MSKVIWKARVYSGKIVKLFLRTVFGFDRWHVYTLTEKQYAKDIIVWCNRRQQRNAFAEIGCGMGDIVRKVHYRVREGYDLDERVLKAARLLSGIRGRRHVRFATFHFPESPLPGQYDVLLMVNWIHHVPPEVLKAKIREYFSDALTAGGCIIIDTVGDPEYKYNHDIGYLTEGLGATVSDLGTYERDRRIWIINR
ncbi:MAG TPA: class I SAM-dependent methyltransferase [Puia sp.]|uniref:class I SAM-dependent methyltransferase n=1 Tax=Puia sp. TaxID=2045100 RepID=UPI002B73C092|nr:class I SAM-dependent methyltransferase [Puia sp.]HVU99203.1 class I SAM-dependent methyltransferase [Puia sp.]